MGNSTEEVNNIEVRIYNTREVSNIEVGICSTEEVTCNTGEVGIRTAA